MAVNRIYTTLGRLLAACIAVTGLVASEQHGVVKSGGLPIPGATVTAIQGDKKIVTTTDEQGTYSFPDLADGVWTIQVEMLGFDKLSREVGIDAQAPSPQWELKLQTAASLKAALAAASAPPPTPAAPAPAAATTTPAPTTPTAAAAAKPNTPAPAPAAAAAKPAANSGGRGTQNSTNGRPSLRQAVAQNNGFQRLAVTQSGDAAEPATGAAADTGFNSGGDLNQSATDALVVNGSVSSGLDMPQQNDWMGGRGGMGGFGPGGPGGDFGMNGPGGPGGDTGLGGGGRGGPGGGGPGGGGGGRGGGGMAMAGGGGGGRGGFGGGFPGGGRGGPGGGRGGDRGGRGGRGNPNSFGNGRRDRRMTYTGNLAFILDNSALDAKSYSLTGQNTAKAAYAKSRMTAMIGGPLKIPHLLSGQHTTFTLNYQLTRNRNGNTVTGLVPTAAELGGDFSKAVNQQGTPVTIFDPQNNGAAFPNNMIPQSRLDPTNSPYLNLLKYYPAPNFTGSTRYNYQAPIVGITNQDNINTRISETINAKNQISGGFSYQRSNTSSPYSLFQACNGASACQPFTDSTAMTGINANINWSYHFTTRLISNLRYQFSRSATNATPYFVANNTNVSGLAGIAGNDQASQFYGPPSLSFQGSGITGLGDGQYSRNHNQTSAVGDSFIFIKGLHNITFGGDFRRQQFNQFAEQNARGQFVFNGTLTANPLANGLTATGTGYDLADFLLGYPDTASIAYGNADKYFRADWFDLLVNDDWRITTKVSLNYGLRWDYQVPANEKYGRLVNLNPWADFSAAAAILAPAIANPKYGEPCPSNGSLLHSDWHEFQPRFGVAYRPFTKHSTRINAGYGIYFNTSVYQGYASLMAQQSPLSYTFTAANANLLTVQNILTCPPGQSPLPAYCKQSAASLTVSNTYAVDPDFRLGYVQAWQVSVQQSLKAALVATFAYNGNKGTHQPQTFLPNTYPTGTVNAPSGPAGYQYQTTFANSSYNSGSAQLQRRFRSGFSGNLMYIYAHAIDDAAGVGGRGGGGGGIAQNWLDLAAERSRSSYDQRQRVNMQMQYSTGVGTRGGTLLNGWKGTLLKDWTITTNLGVGTGLPLSAIVPSTTRGTGITGTLRPNLTGLSIYTNTIAGSNLNPLAFAVPGAGEWGDAGRNIITGPGQFSLNASAGRTFRLGERKNVDIRFDSTNMLNHPVVTNWNTTVGNAQFGFPTSVGAMRSFNATLRFHF